MKNAKTKAKHKVAILAYEGLCTFEFGIAIEVFALDRPELNVPWYKHRVFSFGKSPITATGGFLLNPKFGESSVKWADTLIIPGWRDIDGNVPSVLLRAITNAYRRGTRLVSICSGISVLAATGLLNGKKATTHWRYVGHMRRLYPKIDFQPDILYVEDDNIFTSAGSAAGIDLCLHIVRIDYGIKVANAVAKRLVVPTHREGGQQQFISSPVTISERSMSPLLDEIRRDLDKSYSVAKMANLANYSERTFIRKFKESTGKTPQSWLTEERIRYARSLLETSHLTTEQIADKCGFKTAETFRHHFKKSVGIPPMRYRSSFR